MRRIGALICCVVVALLSSTTPADASVPSLALSFASTRVDQNTPLSLTVSTSGLPQGAKVVLQRQFGTKKVFKTVETVPASGETTAPGVPIGKYGFRLAAVKGKTVVATSKVKTVYSYGDITAAQLCSRSDYTEFSSCGPGSIRVGEQVFTYQAYNASQEGPDGDSGVSAQRSSCRAAHIEYAVPNDAADDGVTGVGIAAYQEAADAQSSLTPSRQVGVADVSLSSAAWDLVFWTEGDWDYYVRWRGTFNCYTTDGDR